MKCHHCDKETDEERIILNDDTVFCCGTCLTSCEIRKQRENVENEKPELSFM